jgi:hypothetical protein
MSWYWIIYLFVMLSKIQAILIVFTVLSGVVFVVTSIYRMPHEWGDINNRVDYFSSLIKWWWVSIIAFIMLLFSTIAVPSKKEIALIMIGGAVGEFVENDENAKKLPADLFMLLRKEILEEVNDLPTDVKERLGEELGVDLRNEEEKLIDMSKEELIEMYKKQAEKLKTPQSN